jgi:DNA-binding NarL/FixJ family response regulator
MSGTPAACGRLRLILIDDHAGARAAFVQRLACDTHVDVVGATADVGTAIELAERERPHVVLVDTRREDDSALAIVAALARLPLEMRPLVAVHLSFFDSEQWLLAQTAGAREWVLKGFDLGATVRRLHDAIVRELPRERWPGAC